MTTTDKRPGIRYMECGARLDPGERCDCEKIIAERKLAGKKARTRRIIEHNLRVVEHAMIEWDYA